MGFLYSQLFITPKYPTTSFAGQTIVVTGSNTGLGKEAARHFARLGASKVIIACRNTKAGDDAKSDILSTLPKIPPSVLEVWQLDLADYGSIKSFADRVSKLQRLDVLLNNAGVASQEFKLINGHESTLAINDVSTFLLSLLCLPKLKQTVSDFNTQPRVVIVTSEVHGHTKFNEWKEPHIFEALNDEKKSMANFGERYPISKLIEVLVVRQLAPKLEGSGVVLNMLNPGLCQSGLSRDQAFPASLIFWLIKTVLARTTEVGSRTLVAAATVREESHGKYMTDALVDDNSLSAWSRSEEGRNAGEKVWKELKVILEEIEPGVTQGL